LPLPLPEEGETKVEEVEDAKGLGFIRWMGMKGTVVAVAMWWCRARRRWWEEDATAGKARNEWARRVVVARVSAPSGPSNGANQREAERVSAKSARKVGDTTERMELGGALSSPGIKAPHERGRQD